jgi:flagellar biosynthesis protein FlhF
MNSKVFKARSIQQALANIKDEFGSDALILNTRKIPKKPLDPYAGEMVEVEAQVPDTLPTPSFKAPDIKSDNNDMAGIREDLSQIKDIISIAGFGSGMRQMVCNHFESVGVLASLLNAGVSDSLAAHIIQKASSMMDDTVDQGTKIKSLKKYVMRQCMNQIQTRDAFVKDTGSTIPHVAAFVGPTGVGKTTTIAKLAACLNFQRKMKVGLISIDNYRVGAFEQLKAYASIMGLPCVSAFNSQDLTSALDRMTALDVVLIDTAGHSHFDKARIEEIYQLIKTDFRISSHLVLSVTSESTIMKDAASAFSIFNPDTIVFSKIDETKRCGKILDHLIDLALPVSLVTNGQKVPEDLIIPDRRELLRIILGKGSKEN